MVGTFAFTVATDADALVVLVVRRQRADASCRQQLGVGNVESAFLHLVAHWAKGQGGGQHHVGSHLLVFLIAVHKVVETIGRLIIEGVGKRSLHLVGQLLPFLEQRTLRLSGFQQFHAITQGVIP